MATTRKKKDDSEKKLTEQVRPYHAYEMDFIKKGTFEEKNDYDENQIELRAHWWPGVYDGKKWHQVVPGDGESFLVNAIYRNQNNVEITIEEYKISDERFKEAVKFIKTAVKEFFLMRTEEDNGWIKFMTVSEAKELLDFLKLEVEFPS